MHFIPGLTLRCSEEAEILGTDDSEMGEFAYDYVGLEQEIGHTIDTNFAAAGGAREPDHHVKSVASAGSSAEREKVSMQASPREG
jgi:Amt family ammonium transporter